MITQRPADWVDRIPLGTRIMAADGYTERYGQVYGRIKTRWGSALRVKFDDYTFDTCMTLNTGPGIGWHLIHSLPDGGMVIGNSNRKAVA